MSPAICDIISFCPGARVGSLATEAACLCLTLRELHFSDTALDTFSQDALQ